MLILRFLRKSIDLIFKESSLSLSLSWSIFMQGKSESLLDRRHYNFRLNAPAHTKKKLIKLKDVNSLVYQMESLGSKTANCITPEELWFPFHRLKCLSPYSIYIYHQWFWSMFWKKPEPIKKIYNTYISFRKASIDHWSYKFLIAGSLHKIYHASTQYLEPPYFIKPSLLCSP